MCEGAPRVPRGYCRVGRAHQCLRLRPACRIGKNLAIRFVVVSNGKRYGTTMLGTTHPTSWRFRRRFAKRWWRHRMAGRAAVQLCQKTCPQCSHRRATRGGCHLIQSTRKSSPNADIRRAIGDNGIRTIRAPTVFQFSSTLFLDSLPQTGHARAGALPCFLGCVLDIG